MFCWCRYCRPGLEIWSAHCSAYICTGDHHTLLFPSIRAIINSLISLPLFPLIADSVHTTASSLDGDSDSIYDTLKMSRSIPKRSFGISLGTVSGALVIFICIFLLHRPCYERARQRRRRAILIGHEFGMSADVRRELLPRQAQNPEISHFSADS